jgi:phosphoserine phosphatase
MTSSSSLHEPFRAVAFDCDSTLSSIEGIDELARRVGRLDEIGPLTAQAMDGSLSIEAVYARRMEMVRPDRAALDWLAQRYLDTITPEAADAMARVRQAGMAVHIVSGGLRPAILPLATRLGVSAEDVHAVEVQLDGNGRYVGFDAASPLTRASGKAEVCAMLIARHGATALVGDGMTDVAARSVGAHVIGYGGIVSRDAVRASADAFVADRRLTAVVPLLLAGTPVHAVS